MFVCLDLETTGLNPREDHVIEVAIVHFDHNGILEEWSSLVRPPVPIPEFTKRLTGIDDAMVKDAPTLDELKERIIERIGDAPIMGHFIFFDVNFLNHHGFDFQNPQLDSCQLTQILLHKEPSYSLEVLVKKLELNQPDAHRALDDVKANIELFWKLQSHLQALSSEQKDSIRPILQKSQWDWAPVVLTMLEKDGGELITPTASAQKDAPASKVDLTAMTQDLKAPFLLEESSHNISDWVDYAKNVGPQSLLVVPHLDMLPKDSDLGSLKHPDQYLDEDRLARFLDKDSLDSTESMLGIKALLWQTETGDRNELRLIKEENQAWPDICCQSSDTPNSYYKKALESAQSKAVTVIDHAYFLKDRSRKQPTLDIPEHVVIGSVEQFVKSIEYAWHIRLSESRFLNDLHCLREENPDFEEVITHLASKVSILFGFIGMVIQRHGEPNDPRHTLIVEAYHRNTTEWNKVMQSALSIQSATAALGDDIADSPTLDELQRYLRYLAKILQTHGPVLWLTLDKDQHPILHAFPEGTSQLFTGRIWDEAQFHCFAHHANLNDDFAFIKKELGMEDWTYHTAEESPAYPLQDAKRSIANPKDPSNVHDVIHELDEQLEHVDGDAMLLVTSKHSGENFFYNLKKTCEKHDRKLFVQYMSGGLGKIVQMARGSSGRNIFVGNEHLLNMLLKENMDLHFLGIHRLPFSPPNDPIQKARAAQYADAYREFSLPQAKLRLKNIMHRFLGDDWTGKTMVLLDPRARDMGFY